MLSHRWLFPFLISYSLLRAFFARLTGRLELVAGLPLDGLCLFAGEPAEDEAETGHLGVAAEVQVSVVLIGRLMVVVSHEVL